MAYNNYYPQFYPSAQPTFVPQTMPQQTTQQSNNGITWVQGENSAKSYPVMAGQSVLLMDSENPVMYIKSTDQSGMPLPLRIFDYTERKNDTQPLHTVAEPKVDYVSREEFNDFKHDIETALKATKPTPVKKTTREE